MLVGPQLGLGRAALDLVREKAAKKPISYTFFTAQADSVAFQLQLAEAAMLIDTAHLHAYRAADDIDRAAAAGVYPDFLARARVRADTGWAHRAHPQGDRHPAVTRTARAASPTSTRCSGSGGTPRSPPGTRSCCR